MSEAGSSGRRGPQRGRQRLGPMRRPERYGFLVILLLADVAIVFAVPPGSWWGVFMLAFMAGTLLLALNTTRVSRRALTWGLGAAIGTVALGILGAAIDSRTLLGIAYLLLVCLLVGTPALILKRIFGDQTVTMQTMLGAIAVYLLIGLIFTFVFMGVNGVMENLNPPQPFLAQGKSNDPGSYVYLSFITLATVGYGDLTPATELPRALCVFEGVAGQIFLVTAVSRLVSLYGRPGGDAVDLDQWSGPPAVERPGGESTAAAPPGPATGAGPPGREQEPAPRPQPDGLDFMAWVDDEDSGPGGPAGGAGG
jgi:Ion channel